MERGEYTVVDGTAMAWTEATVEHTGGKFQVKRLFKDPDTGMGITLLHYPAGFTNPLHTHQCGHGMYILEGTLKTHRGTYGPGSFVWFPEGEEMEHGGTAEEAVTALFITNKSFTIGYKGIEEKP